MSQFKKMTGGQRAFKRAEAERNRLVERILSRDKGLCRIDALREANRMMNVGGPKRFRGTQPS